MQPGLSLAPDFLRFATDDHFFQMFLDLMLFMKRLAAEAGSKAQETRSSKVTAEHITAVKKVRMLQRCNVTGENQL